MKKEAIESILELLSTPQKIAIIPHKNPDGDAMGSTLGLYHFLLKLNHEPVVIAPNNFPNFLAWLPGSEKILIFENEVDKTTKILQEASIVFTLDFNALHRVGTEMENVLKTLQSPFIMIDHHQKPDDYAKYMFSDTNYGSTCEMLYHFISQLGFLNLIDKTSGTCIYTGILTDSGSFRYPKTTGATHRIVADLIDLGVENTNIPSLLFDNNSYERLQLMGCAFQNLKIISEKNTSYTTLSQKELDSFNYVKGDTEGLVNYGLTIKGIIFAAIFIENQAEKIIKISFRSQGNFDVNIFSRTYFEGGGHINAAGGKSSLSLDETILKFTDIINSIEIN